MRLKVFATVAIDHRAKTIEIAINSSNTPALSNRDWVLLHSTEFCILPLREQPVNKLQTKSARLLQAQLHADRISTVQKMGSYDPMIADHA